MYEDSCLSSRNILPETYIFSIKFVEIFQELSNNSLDKFD